MNAQIWWSHVSPESQRSLFREWNLLVTCCISSIDFIIVIPHIFKVGISSIDLSKNWNNHSVYTDLGFWGEKIFVQIVWCTLEIAALGYAFTVSDRMCKTSWTSRSKEGKHKQTCQVEYNKTLHPRRVPKKLAGQSRDQSLSTNGFLT